MNIRRTRETVTVTEPGHAEDDTNIHEFTVVEDLTEDDFDRILAEDGILPKAHVVFKRSGTRDQLGTEWWQTSEPPQHVVAHLEAKGYIVG